MFESNTGKLLGAQTIGKGIVDKRADVFATAINAGMTVEDLQDLELCYAPPYSTGKDVVIFNVAIVIFFAAASGNQVGFAIGRKIGRPLLDKYKGPKIQKIVQRSETFYKRNGWWSVFAARFIPWVRTFVPTIAGASKMNYYSFSSANLLGALVWGVGITLAGYYTATLPWVETWTYSIAAFTIIASIIFALVDYLRHRQQRPHTS